VDEGDGVVAAGAVTETVGAPPVGELDDEDTLLVEELVASPEAVATLRAYPDR
jgi:hypothetical protein